MRQLIRTLLLAITPFGLRAQQNPTLTLDIYAKENLMYANSMPINTANHYHFRSPLAAGATLFIGLPVSSRVLFQAGLGYAPTKYSLKFSLDSNSLVYKYKVDMNIGTVKLPVRFQFSIASGFSLLAGITFNYNRNWPCNTSKSYHYTAVDNYQFISSYDQYKTSYLEGDYITFSADLAVKYRLRNWLEFFAMGSYDMGKYPSISIMNQVGVNGGYMYSYQGAISPKLLTLSIGASWRLREYTGHTKPKGVGTTQNGQGRKSPDVDVLNGVLPQ